MNDHPPLEAKPGHQLGGDLVLIDHRAVDAVHFRQFVAIGDVRQHRAPYHYREPEPSERIFSLSPLLQRGEGWGEGRDMRARTLPLTRSSLRPRGPQAARGSRRVRTSPTP